MKKLILSAALATLVASPAFAQATQLLRQPPAYAVQRVLPGQAILNGYAAPYGYARGAIVEGGHVVGQDPDPNIQLQLKRDPVADYGSFHHELAKPGLAPGFAL